MASAIEALRKLLPYMVVAVVVVASYTAWTLYSRWQAQRDDQRHSEEQRAKSNRAVVEKYGSGNLKIMGFYANPPSLRAGEKGLLCYSVANARTVHIDPVSDPVWPSLSRCLEISPLKTTRYTLTAEDSAGHTATQAVEVGINP
jgi:hypothetical protein